MTDIQDRLATGKGKFTPLYPDLGTGPGQLRGLDLAGVLRGRAGGGVQADVALRRPRGAAWPDRARSSPVSCPATWRRSWSPAASTAPCTPSTTCAPTAATRSCGRSTRKEETGGLVPAVRLQVPRLALRPRRVRHPRHQRGGVLRPRQGLARHAEGGLRGVRRVRLREPVGGPDAAAHVHRRPHRRARGVPVREDDPALRVLHPDPRQLEARGRLGVRVVPPALRPRPLHRPRRLEGREDGAAGRRLPLRRLPAPPAHLGARPAAAASPASRAPRVRRRATSAGSTSCSGPACSAPTTCPTSASSRTSSTRAASPRGATTSSGCSRTSRSRSGRGTTTSPTRTGPSRSTRTSTRSTSTSCRRRTRPTASRRSSWSTARSSSPCRT